MAKVVRKIEAAAPAPVKLKRVAAYARVSMETERLNHSLSAQVSYYSELIQKHPGWVYAGVYADDGISGTKVNRPEFQKMLAECEAGNIDIILTKSISRFARNTVDLLETVHHLKELGIEVQFEKEHISSRRKAGAFRTTSNGVSGSAWSEASLRDTSGFTDTTGRAIRWCPPPRKQPS